MSRPESERRARREASKAMQSEISQLMQSFPTHTSPLKDTSSSSNSSTSATATATTPAAATEKKKLSCNPGSHEQYIGRVDTFKLTTWFSKPDLSPLECARFGWRNSAEDILECVTCKERINCKIDSKLPPARAKVIVQNLRDKLQSAHKATCPWARSFCDASFATPPIDVPAIEREAFVKRCAALAQHHDELPPLQASSEVRKGIALLQDVSHAQPEECVLALCGWSVAAHRSAVSVQCATCRRLCAVGNFDAIDIGNIVTGPPPGVVATPQRSASSTLLQTPHARRKSAAGASVSPTSPKKSWTLSRSSSVGKLVPPPAETPVVQQRRFGNPQALQRGSFLFGMQVKFQVDASVAALAKTHTKKRPDNDSNASKGQQIEQEEQATKDQGKNKASGCSGSTPAPSGKRSAATAATGEAQAEEHTTAATAPKKSKMQTWGKFNPSASHRPYCCWHSGERAKTLYAVLTTGVRRTPSSAKGHQQKLKVDTATARMELRKMLAGEFEDQQEQDGEAQHS
eukprot:m.89312 g.89312  ORF g.89312 m.89312 type:complete len:517 (+) comp12890_c0_seq1:91-1641(+)